MKQENREEMERANKNGQRVFGALLVIFVIGNLKPLNFELILLFGILGNVI